MELKYMEANNINMAPSSINKSWVDKCSLNE